MSQQLNQLAPTVKTETAMVTETVMETVTVKETMKKTVIQMEQDLTYSKF